MRGRVTRAAGTDVHLVRHGETRCYTSDSGLTELGAVQARRRGELLAGEAGLAAGVSLSCAPARRARETAEHLRLGLLGGLAARGLTVPVGDVEVVALFGNFQVSTPWGVGDVTAVHDQHVAERERVGAEGSAPTWVTEIESFWAAESTAGDPIAHWLITPMLHVEPPASCVARLWAGVVSLDRHEPGRTQVVVTHSGPMRAFVAWAMGEDLGEPDNGEDVLVRLLDDASASVRFRRRVREVRLPSVEALPDWWAARPDADPPVARPGMPAGAS